MFSPCWAADKAPNPAPATTPTPKHIKNVIIAKCPVGSYLLTGSLLQYEYKFKPLMFVGSKYSIESGEIHLHNSGQ